MNQNKVTSFTLSCDVLKCLPFHKYDKDFTFIVDNKEYKTSRIIADVLSPQIRNYHTSDATIDTFTITTNETGSEHDFSTILSLIKFDLRELSDDELEYYRTIFFLLGNDNEYAKLFPKFSGEITTKNVFDLIESKQRRLGHRHDLLVSVSRDEIEFISGHFYEIDKSGLKKLGIEIINEVVKSQSLRVGSEDSLLKFVIEIYLENRSASFLFDYVVFENVSKDALLEFYKSFDLADIDSEVWRMIVERALKQEPKSSLSSRYRVSDLPLLHEEGKEFNGIVKYLTNKTGGNIHKNGTIEVTSCGRQSDNPWNLLDFDEETFYCSNHGWDTWVCYDFMERKVKVTSYSINSVKGRSSHHLKSWVIEVSDDGSKWTQIDEQKESQKLNGTNLIATFDVNPSEYSRYVRLRNTAEPWGGNCLWFSSLEFYGYLKDKTK
ncbi:hypothetical protein M9Y10_033521 [Tritrichomonas musculus]|uniref:F5/8 type C domain-containing protein n=1 Tax=Tritrichomonas musculus TaxID=1915356 RepID=A0ABR2KEB8_9EUKA